MEKEKRFELLNPKEQVGKTFSVKLNGNKTADLQVEEYHPYEPSAYVMDSGWTCFDLNTDTEYFVSESGSVWKQPENREVGIVPEIVDYLNEMEQKWEKHYIG